MNSDTSTFIPQQYTGKKADLEKSITKQSKQETIVTYNRACKRLLNPLIWHELAGSLSASFIPVNADGSEIKRLLQPRDFLMIDIPGPGSLRGNGYDWVIVEKIAENVAAGFENSFGIVLRSSVNPQQPVEGNAHFFDGSATSTFIIKYKENEVIATYHGRNEEPNTENVPTLNKIRNAMVSAGAMSFLSELQWLALLHGFLQEEL